MRRMPLAIAVLLTAALASMALGQSSAPRKQAPKTRPAAKTPAKGGANAADRARLLVPGLGGAPPRRKAAAPVLPPLAGGKQGGSLPAPFVPPGGARGLPTLGGLQPRPMNRMLLGVNVAWGEEDGTAGWDRDNGARAQRLGQLLKAGGFTNTRITVRWADIEEARGRYEWRELDRFVNHVVRLGLRPVCLVTSTPSWAASSDALPLFTARGLTGSAALRPPDPAFHQDLGRFAHALALRYKDRINHWEFWSEPDAGGMPVVERNAAGMPTEIRMGGDAALYAKLLGEFSRGVRKADPAAKVAIGGLRTRRTEFLAALYGAAARPHFNAIALHPALERGGLDLAWIDQCRAVAVRNGDGAKPFWITEWGWRTRPASPEGVTERQQARLIRESLTRMRERPFIQLASYQSLNDWRTEEQEPETVVAAGLTSWNMTPRAGYFAFREAATGTPAEPARAYARVALVGALPMMDEAGVRGRSSEVVVDAGRPLGPMPRVWEGVSQSVENGDAEFLSTLPARLTAIGTKLVRFDPFPSPDMVRRQAVVIEGASAPREPEFEVDWRYADEMVGVITRAGAKPVFNFATVPVRLTAPTGNTRMPRDLDEWGALVRLVVRRYNGEQRRGIVYWELGGEPNRGAYAPEEYLRLYEAFAAAVRSQDPKARIGGPALSGLDEEWLKALAVRCAEGRLPLDFVSWHAYDVTAAELARQVGRARALLRKVRLPGAVELMVSEWNLSARATDLHDRAAGATRALSLVEALADSGPARAFFHSAKEGRDFRKPDASVSGRWGLVTWNNKPKPVYNAFRLLNRLEGARLPAESDDTEVHSLSTRQGSKVAVLVWRDRDEASGTDQDLTPVKVRLNDLPGGGTVAGNLWSAGSLEVPLAELAPPARFTVSGAHVEIPLMLAPGDAVLLELNPGEPLRAAVALEAARYVAYGGGQIRLTATLRNVTDAPLTTKLSLTCSDDRIVPAKGLNSSAITLAGGETRAFGYEFKAPLTGAEGRKRFRLAAAGVGETVTEVSVVAPVVVRVAPGRADTYRAGALPDSMEATATARVTAENRSDVPVQVGLVTDRTSNVLRLGPGQTATVPVTVAAPGSAAGAYRTEIKTLLAGKPFAALPVEVGVPAVSKYAQRKPRINGDLSEWGDALPLELKVSGGEGRFAARAFTQWDEQYLYVAVVVEDPTTEEPLSPERMLRGDSVVLGFDPRRSAAPEQEGYRAEDHEISIARAPLGAAVHRFQGGTPGPVKGATAAVQRVGERTVYEAAIPWSALRPAQPRTRALLGFSVLVNDGDTRFRRTAAWGGGLLGAKKPGQFVGLRLIR